jgi:hypothetical protein
MSFNRVLTDSMGLVHHLPRRIRNAHLSTASIHKSWAEYWEKEGNHKLAMAHHSAAAAAGANDREAYLEVIRVTGITAYDFTWYRQLKEEQQRVAA